jgi:hypothetical protein
MKKIVCLTFVLFTSIGVFAQDKTIQKAEFDKMLSTSLRLLSRKAHRIIETYNTQSFWLQKSRSNNSPPVVMLSSKNITEILPSVGRHSIYESNSRLGKTKREFFSVGEKQYTREGEGAWLGRIIKGAAKSQFQSHALNPLDSSEKYKEYKFLGNEKLDNQNTKVYLVIRKTQPATPKTNRPANSKIYPAVKDGTCKYWFGKDGILLKSECKTEFYSVPRESSPLVITHSIKLYELDPKIKITAPKIN